MLRRPWLGGLLVAALVLSLAAVSIDGEAAGVAGAAHTIWLGLPLAAQAQGVPVAIVDNVDPGFAVVGGEWGTCQDGDCQGTCYGADFRFAEPRCGECRARYNLQAPGTGDYDLWTWWPWGEDRATDTPFTVVHGSESLTMVVDQRNSGDDWWWLVTLNLAAGEEVTVTVQGSASGFANADAVALTPIGSGSPSQQQGQEASPGASDEVAPQPAKGPVVQYFYSEATPREGCYYLHWDVSEADTVTLDGQPVDNPGSTEVCPSETTDYRLSADNATGDTEQVFTLEVGASEATAEPPPPPPPSEPAVGVAPASGAIIVDRTCTDLSRIPQQWIEAARRLTLHYAHTSHGEQIIAGITKLEEVNPLYDVAVRNWDPAGLPDEGGALRLYDGNNYDGDNYITPEMYWNDPDGQQHTRSVAGTGLFSLSMWSWCGQQSENSPEDVQRYLETLNQFEAEFTGMRFIYMTGHSDGTTGGVLARNNQAVRDYVRAQGKVLFDFEDIETHDPDGNYYPNDGEAACLWCDSWCAAHPEDCTNLPDWCPHSEASQAQKYNCKLKANAFWWLMARLAGWDGVSP